MPLGESSVGRWIAIACLGVVLLAALIPGRAEARPLAEDGPRLAEIERKCLGAWALPSLRIEERNLLYEWCLLSSHGLPPTWADVPDDLVPQVKPGAVIDLQDAFVRLARIEAKLAGIPVQQGKKLRPWELVAARRLVGPTASLPRPEDDRHSRELRELLELPARQACFEKFAEQWAASPSDAKPLISTLLPSGGSGCPAVEEGLRNELVSYWTPVVVVALPGSTVEVLVPRHRGVMQAPRVRFTQLESPGEIPLVDVHIAFVPYNARLIVETTPPAETASELLLPIVNTRVAAGRTVLDLTDRSDTSCLSLDVAVGPGRVVLLDGQVVETAVPIVPRGLHTLSILRPVGDAWVIESEDVVDANLTTFRNECSPVQLDLRPSRGVTLTPVNVDDSCGDFGPSGSRIWGTAARHLQESSRRSRLEFRDLHGVASAADWLREIQAALTSLGGDPIGADRGDLDTVKSVGVSASELWRQGVSRVISLEVQCRRDPAGHGLRISLLGRVLKTDLVHRRLQDPVTGVPLREIIRIETEALEEVRLIEPAVRRVVSRLLDLAYLRFAVSPDEVFYADRIEATVELIDGPHSTVQPIFQAFEAPEPVAGSICERLQSSGRLAGRDPSAGSLGREVDIITARETEESGASRTYHLSINPRRPGTLILRTMVPGQPSGAAYHCIDVIQERRQMFVRAGGGTGFGQNLRRPLTPRESTLTRIELGFLTNVRRHGGFQLGFGGGFGTVATRLPEGAPDWADLVRAAEAGEALPEGEVSWLRYAILLGPRAMWRFSFCRKESGTCPRIVRRLLWGLDITLDADIGIFQPREVPEGLVEFRSRFEPADFDIDVSIGALVGLRHSPRQAILVGINIWTTGADDFVLSRVFRTQQDRGSPTYDSAWVWGIVARYDWSLR